MEGWHTLGVLPLCIAVLAGWLHSPPGLGKLVILCLILRKVNQNTWEGFSLKYIFVGGWSPLLFK